MVKLWWNESLKGTDDAQLYFRFGSSAAACTSASWSSAYSEPNGISLSGLTADAWVQFKMVLSATDTIVSNPRIYAASGYVVKFSYSKGGTPAESAVEFIYDVGYRHFDQPMIDKIFKKIMTRHEGTQGDFTVRWEARDTFASSTNGSGTFTVDLATNPGNWASFFPANAMGKDLKIQIYKNDLYDFNLKEVQGVFTPEPLII
jgi:hypothetical protein